MNGRIATQLTIRPFAEAVAIQMRRLSALAPTKQLCVCELPRPKQSISAANGDPGLNDSHMHPIRGGLNYNMELRWDGVPSLADACAC
jgi:predicted amidohydrolase YtcJ